MIPPSLQRNPDLDTWLAIQSDGTVTVFTGKVELGQGIKTALARIAAEELDVAPARVRVRTADTASGPNELYTVGSNSLEESGTALRLAAAEARRALLELAAEELGAHVSALRVDDGAISAPGRAATTTYFALFGGKRFERKVAADAPAKPSGEYRVLGRPGARIGMSELVTGKALFVQDLRFPGMAHARVVRGPSARARLAAVDVGDAQRMPGVAAVVRDGSFLAVAAETAAQAVAAAEQLRRSARWQGSLELPEQGELYAWMRRAEAKSYPVEAGVAVDAPLPPKSTPTGVARTLRASYARPYQMHASIGPSAAVARLVDGALTIWTHTQGVSVLRPAIAQALRLPVERVRLVHVEGPGCYGHNGADDVAFDAALVAQALPGRPVHLQWTRADEHVFEPYGPAMVIDLEASLDAEGRVADWCHESRSFTHALRAIPFGERVSGLLAAWQRDPALQPPSARPMLVHHGGVHRNADPLYAFPRRRIVKHFLPESPLRTSALRGLGAYANVFALESFMDELAHEAGADPVEFRLRHLEDERAREVVRAAADRFGWSRSARPAANGRGHGIAFARYKNQKSWAAVAVELSVDDSRAQIRLERGVIAADAGQIVDPDGLVNQLEGGFVQSASWTLHEEVRFDRERVTSTDWGSYPILRFSEVPELETVLLDRPGQPWLGAGEA
ncbi:MAG TPA: molybdopterin cofactor-binding domain-containing protein, partial [Myxococcota bacterium]|nr:molybdopterin cofactor-binding domain-containing protein [Myxococcota bacterium]